MIIIDFLTSGLNAFAEQFHAQAQSAGLPGSEHAVHFCLALGLQTAWGLPPGAIVFERPSQGRSRIDLWVREPHDLAIEVKYLRASPGGSAPATPMHYGQTLADFNKLAHVPCRLGLVVVVADGRYVSYIERSGRSLLPLKVGDSATITRSSLDQLPVTPRRKASAHGEWMDLHVALLWLRQTGGCSLFAWSVKPERAVPGPSDR